MTYVLSSLQPKLITRVHNVPCNRPWGSDSPNVPYNQPWKDESPNVPCN